MDDIVQIKLMGGIELAELMKQIEQEKVIEQVKVELKWCKEQLVLFICMKHEEVIEDIQQVELMIQIKNLKRLERLEQVN